jgi:hypothetical protein
MESKYNNIRELPEMGNCVVNSDEGIAIQLILVEKGHYWKFTEHNEKIWDPATDESASAWWDESNIVNGEKYYILNWYEDRGYTWSTAIASISHFDNMVEFDEYFEKKDAYKGYFTGKHYGV